MQTDANAPTAFISPKASARANARQCAACLAVYNESFPDDDGSRSANTYEALDRYALTCATCELSFDLGAL